MKRSKGKHAQARTLLLFLARVVLKQVEEVSQGTNESWEESQHHNIPITMRPHAITQQFWFGSYPQCGVQTMRAVRVSSPGSHSAAVPGPALRRRRLLLLLAAWWWLWWCACASPTPHPQRRRPEARPCYLQKHTSEPPQLTNRKHVYFLIASIPPSLPVSLSVDAPSWVCCVAFVARRGACPGTDCVSTALGWLEGSGMTERS